MFHKVDFAPKDAVPRIRLEREDGANVAQRLVSVSEAVRQT